MKNYNLATVVLLLICTVFTTYGQDMSFSLDLNNTIYPEAGKQVSIGSNSLGAWDTDLVILTDPDGDGIYRGLYKGFPTGAFLFRVYQNTLGATGNWGGDWITSAASTDDCKEQTDGGSNYSYDITQNTSVDLSFKLEECYTVSEGIILSNKSYNLIDFSVYPNPAEDFLTIKTDKKVRSIAIYNLLGSKVLENRSYNEEEKINVSSLSPGMYAVIVESEGTKSTVKFVKK